MTGAPNTEDFQCQRSLGYWIRRIHSTLIPRMEHMFEKQELTFTQWITLVALKDGLVGTAAELSRHISYDSGATTRLLDQLETRGYVRRLRSKDDRRVILLTITAGGASIANRLTDAVIKYWNRTLTGFSEADRKALLTLLTRLFQSIEAEANQ